MATTNPLANFLGVSDICRLAKDGTTASHVANWRKLDPTFPDSIGYLGGRPVYRKSEVTKWLKRNGKLAV